MKQFRWDPEKNARLIRERRISFEEVVLSIAKGYALDIIEHANPEKYRHQKMFVVEVNRYAYLVPFVEREDEIFLKTVIPSRKATRAYLQRRRGANGQSG